MSDATENLHNLLEDILPPDSAFILMVTKAEEASHPAFIHNLRSSKDVIEAYRAIVDAFDFEQAMGKNGGG